MSARVVIALLALSSTAWGQTPGATPSAAAPASPAASASAGARPAAPASVSAPARPAVPASESPAPESPLDAFDPDSPPDPETLVRLFRLAEKREEDLRRREAELRRREERLQTLQRDLDADYEALRLLQEELSARVKPAPATPPEGAEAGAKDGDGAKEREANVTQLARVFEKMKPAEVAKVVPQMEEGLVIEVLSRLKDRQAAKILGGLDPGLAGKLSQKLVDRKKKDQTPRK